MTRQSGYSVAAVVRFKVVGVETTFLRAGDDLTVEMSIPDVRPGARLGFGGWFCATGAMEVETRSDAPADYISDGQIGVWCKFGSQWVSDSAGDAFAAITFTAMEDLDLALYGIEAGHVSHEALDDARPELLTNMWRFAPEANFFPAEDGEVSVHGSARTSPGEPLDLALKSCNRCGRFLPVNFDPNERSTLSFSNYCVARAPCTHASFGRITDADDPTIVHQLHYGLVSSRGDGYR